MTNLNTDEIRERIKGGEDLWDELVQALDDEIDRLRGAVLEWRDVFIGDDPAKLIEQRTKAAVWTEVKHFFVAEHPYPDDEWLMADLKQAIDSAKT